MDTVVKMQDVHKSFNKTEVLCGVSLEVARGQVTAIIGKSGSGKSTALRCIDRLETIDSGQITVCGHAVHSEAVNLKKLRLDVGIVFQSYNLFPHLTVAQNVGLALRLVHRKSRADVDEVTERVIRQVGMLDKLLSYPEELSGGQQQRVAIARALAMEPQVMLFDEITSALDPALTGEVLQVMESLAKGGMTTIAVTHEMSFASRVADQIVYMHEGKVHEVGGPSILTNPQTLELQKFIGNGL